MDILLYLTSLLKTRKTIGIAGLGTLYKKKSPGKYDRATHSFMPPSFKLSFTTEIKEEEELASYVSEQRGISLASANYYIAEFVTRLQSQLSEKQEADLGEIGQLKLANGEITLVSTNADTFNFEYYGLPKVAESISNEEVILSSSTQSDEGKLEDIEEENKLEEENPGQEVEHTIEENYLGNIDREPHDEVQSQGQTNHQFVEEAAEVVATERNENIVKEDVVIDQDQYLEEQEVKKGMPFAMKFLISLLAIVALGAIVYFVNPRFFNNYFNKNSQATKSTGVAKPDQTISNAPTDSPKTDNLAANNSLVTLQNDSIPVVDSSKVTIFEVLVSAVSTDKKADKIVANLITQGVKAKKIKISKTMINISAGSFLTEQAAKKYRDSLRITLKNQGIYIQPIKPKR